MKRQMHLDGDSILMTAPTGGLTAGQLIIVRSGTGGRCGIVVNTVAAGAVTPVKIRGTFKGVPANAATGLTFAVGDILYRKASDGKLTKTSTSNTLAGFAAAAKTAAGTTAELVLNG